MRKMFFLLIFVFALAFTIKSYCYDHLISCQLGCKSSYIACKEFNERSNVEEDTFCSSMFTYCTKNCYSAYNVE